MTDALTYLYVPGDVPSRFNKAASAGADAIVLDLEDAVTAARKEYARDTVADWISSHRNDHLEVWVRVNSGILQDTDIRHIAHPNLTGIWLPKVGDASELRHVDTLLTGTAAAHAMVSPLIETAAGLFDAVNIAKSPRVQFLQLGEIDLAVDLGVDIDTSGAALLFARSQIVAASAAAGISPPLAAVSRNFRDFDAFTKDTKQLAGLGFVGRACIHPTQVGPARSVFEPSADDIRGAEAILTRLDESEFGAATDENGYLIDEAVARSARRILERAAR